MEVVDKLMKHIIHIVIYNLTQCIFSATLQFKQTDLLFHLKFKGTSKDRSLLVKYIEQHRSKEYFS